MRIFRSNPRHSRRTSWRLRAAMAVIGTAGAVGVLGSGIALGYWLSTTSNPAQAAADSIPQGATPTPSVNPPTSSTVAITFATVSTSGGTNITAYTVTRYNATTNVSAGTVSGCTVLTSTVTCSDSPGNGSWQYTDTPDLSGTAWTGAESTKSATAVVNVTPPTGSPPIVSAATTFGTNPVYVNNETVTLTDTPTANAGVASVAYYYCAASVPSCTNLTGTLIGAASTASPYSVVWNPLPTTNGTYQVIAFVTDNLGGTANSSATNVAVDTIAPSVSTPSVNGFS
jgi:hypothetical protein